MRFLQIKLHHDSYLSKDYQKAKYEENRFLHLCRPMFDGYRQSLLKIIFLIFITNRYLTQKNLKNELI